jgi:peroxiredoxin
MKKSFIIILCLICILPLYSQIAIGDTAEFFTLPDTAGIEISLQEYSGKIILLNFFTTWCIPCQIEAPQLQDSIWQVFRNRDVTILGINFQERLEPLQNFINDFKLTYPILRDTAGTVFKEYGLTIFPSNVLLNRDGRVAWVEEGFNIPRFVHLIDSLTALSSIETRRVIPTTSPTLFDLHANFPNPFNNQTQISFTLRQREEVSINIMDITGRRIQTIRKVLSPGIQQINVSFAQAASGIYFYSVRVQNETKTGKMIFQK